jgi:non-canonical purine NTP pyrophosphatase (RdgB/HAM1 family)
MKMLDQAPFELLIATHNLGKVNEFRRLLGNLPFKLTDLRDLPEMPVIDETGTTFEANARLKAVGYARASGMHTIADDSGIEVAALDGAPGVHSARFAGAETGYDVKIFRLLAAMDESMSRDRTRASYLISYSPIQMETWSLKQMAFATDRSPTGLEEQMASVTILYSCPKVLPKPSENSRTT